MMNIKRVIGNAELWFNHNFGWFFTNGMKVKP